MACHCRQTLGKRQWPAFSDPTGVGNPTVNP